MKGRFLLTAGASGSGKTLLTCGIMQALKRKGVSIASFKCGPDYIDPMFHSRVLGTKSRNLDTFFADKSVVCWLLEQNSKECDLAVLEGVMGYYDGVAGTTVRASAWEVADATDTPAVLIVNSKGMSVSLVPYIKGFLEYKKNSHIRGVILNRMSPMLYPRMKELIESQLPVKVAGYVPELSDCVLESRHLGLVLPGEITGLRDQLYRLADVLDTSIEWEVLSEIAGEAPKLYTEKPEFVKRAEKLCRYVRIGVAKDEAFCFFYKDNLELLEKMGAELVWFSPLHDKKIPENIHGLMFHGGYPELYAEKLSKNQTMRDSVREAVLQGMPCMAECGGFMYLQEQMEDMEERSWPMAGVIPARAYRTKKLGRFGYITLEGGTVFGKETGPVPAHEFHYFDSDGCGQAFTARKPQSSRKWECIHSTENLLAGFPHLYFYGNSKTAEAFVLACDKFKKRNNL
ncbi:Cobyrinic acid A%2CC-diamide synthase [uncultured Roseburia sp.]|uniref:Cobyrinate a,c-diamide synthase n=1 Tax=Brotonthovivens ammoniilytica TaxID=2981725 RepID=A0ABT2TNS3_9FIRM|nr:cobyrinate a,c-diamide synthase [Brotonthovivens ammoniilytica]MCU6763351.1 cobyrinate a,c-diamide synthase [Brotonthovivens ammoniilytica]SCJ14531.1 Cobyrinic acid A%2CC-diamide synthase [uncultured Roseburia sp.]